MKTLAYAIVTVIILYVSSNLFTDVQDFADNMRTKKVDTIAQITN